MDRFKSIIKTLGFWLVFVVVAILGYLALVYVVLIPILGWILAGMFLLVLIFLFIAKRQIFKIPIIILVALWLIILLIRIATLHISGNELGLVNIFWLLIMAVFYFFGAWLTLKRGILKVIGILLILAVSFAGGLVSTAPDYSRLAMVSNRMIWALIVGMGIFMIIRKGIGLRLLGIGLIIATMLTVFAALFSYASSTVITGKDRIIILASVEPRINDLFLAWDSKDYQKFSKDFNDEMKKNESQDKFLFDRNKLGKLISKDRLGQLAPKSNSPSVAVEAKFIKVMYGATFEKSPATVYVITTYFQKYDNKYSIGGLTFDIIEN